MRNDGTMVMRTETNMITSVGGSGVLMVEGDLKVSCKNLEIDATGDLDLRVDGDYNLNVKGDKREFVQGISQEVVKKNKVAAKYNFALESIKGVIVPKTPTGYTSSWAQYTLRVDRREELMAYLKSQGIPTTIYYPKTMSQTKALAPFLKYQIGESKSAIKFTNSVLSLPMHAYLTDEEVGYICSKISSFYN